MCHSLHDPMFSHFSRTPTCDRQTHDDSIYCASMALRGNQSTEESTNNKQAKAPTCLILCSPTIWCPSCHPFLHEVYCSLYGGSPTPVTWTQPTSILFLWICKLFTNHLEMQRAIKWWHKNKQQIFAQMANNNIEKIKDKCSTVAEMGNHLATIYMGQRWRAVPPFRGSRVPI